MRFLEVNKDGGPKSPVDGYTLIELKDWFSVSLLKFNRGHREGMHSHAFHALSWFVSGHVVEHIQDGPQRVRKGLCFPHFTSREKIHKYVTHKPAWCITIRGPWRKWWKDGNQYLTWGRKVVAEKF